MGNRILAESKSLKPNGVEPELIDERSELRRPRLRKMAAADAEGRHASGVESNFHAS